MGPGVGSSLAATTSPLKNLNWSATLYPVLAWPRRFVGSDAVVGLMFAPTATVEMAVVLSARFIPKPLLPLCGVAPAEPSVFAKGGMVLLPDVRVEPLTVIE